MQRTNRLRETPVYIIHSTSFIHTHSTMKSLIILIVAQLCIIVSPTTTMGGWPKPSEVSNEEKLVNTGQAQPHLYAGKFNFGDSKVWKCTYNNGSGVAISISYPSPPQPPSQKPPTPSSPPTPKMAPPLPKPSPPRPSPKKSPPPPKPSSPPPTPKKSPPPPKPSPPPPTPKKSPPPPKPSPPPTPKMSPPSPTPSPPRPTPKKSPPNPSSLTPNESPPPAKTSILIIHSPPPPHEPIPAQSPPKEPTTPSTQWPPYRNWNPLGHFINCITEFGPSAVCKQQIEVSYYTGRFRVSDYCCNLFVNMRNECSDVILGFYDDRYFLPLLRCTCHVKIY
ncbi:anther-specific proline-rich protein APG-like [Brassica napus]|nr:anther-specific proline-rich protein APG-like [Brassica napus]